MSAAIVARWLEHQILCVLTFNKQLMGCDTQPALGGHFHEECPGKFWGRMWRGKCPRGFVGEKFYRGYFFTRKMSGGIVWDACPGIQDHKCLRRPIAVMIWVTEVKGRATRLVNVGRLLAVILSADKLCHTYGSCRVSYLVGRPTLSRPTMTCRVARP